MTNGEVREICFWQAETDERRTAVAEVTKEFIANVCYETCKLLAQHPEGLRVQQVYDEVAARYPIPEALKQPNPARPQVLRYYNVIGWHTTDEVKAGWLTKNDGLWSLTPEGVEALERHSTPEDFHGEAHRHYKEWERSRGKQAPDDEQSLIEDLKASHSWSRPAGIPGLIGRKKVDWSIFEYGTTIPIEFHNNFEQANKGERLPRGQRHPVQLIVDGEPFDASFANVNRAGVPSNTFQIRYDSNHALHEFLVDRFRHSYEYLKTERERNGQGGKTSIVIPDEEAEYIDFIETGDPFTYKLQVFPFEGRNTLTADTLAPSVSREMLAAFTNLTGVQIEELEKLLEKKKQIIFEGPPGSGKTYVADAFARYYTGNPLVGAVDDHVVIAQFHQSYGYEDFIQGIRPETSERGHLSYVLQDGIFKDLCDTATKRPGERFVIVIDEINRGNIARIFGELLLLLEYRNQAVRLPYAPPKDPLFSIPPNIYVLGTMNTADRSLAQIDYALRRRFYFYRLDPVIDGQAPYLARWLETRNVPESTRERILDLFLSLNAKITAQLGSDFAIGHSYFMSEDIEDPAELDRLWRFAILPLLDEYFHNRRDRLEILAGFSLSALQGASSPSLTVR